MNKPASILSPGGNETTGQPTDSIWPLDGLTLRGLSWRHPDVPQDALPIIGLHGWLDNAATFTHLGPALSRIGDFHCIDFAGHGHSDHRGSRQSYPLVNYVADIAELIEKHFEGPVHIVGHSLGGIVGTLYAASFPERVGRLVMIDSLGPLTQEPDHAPEQLRKGIKKLIRGSGASVTYTSVEQAAKIRAGGLSPLSPRAASTLVPRNLSEVDGGFQWRTDPRLRYPSLSRFDEAQVEAYLKAIDVPTLLIKGEDGLLGGRDRWQSRSRWISALQEVTVPGGHHCHLDGDVEPVIDALRTFLNP